MELGKEVYEVDDEIIEIFLKYPPWPETYGELEILWNAAVVLATGSQNYY
jgi:hypothetical protein